MTTTRRTFKRQESWRLKRVKSNWRRPRGVTSRMRKEKNGWPALVKVGRGSAAATRGRHPKGLIERRVRNESDLEGLNPKIHIIRLSASLGERRRLVLVDRARSLNIHIANPGKVETRPVGEELSQPEKPASEELVESSAESSMENEKESVTEKDSDIPVEASERNPNKEATED